MTHETRATPIRHMHLAFVLLSRLPMPHLPEAAFAQTARAVWAYPLVGAVLGALATGAGWVTLGLGLPPAIAAGLVLAVMVLLSGAMHEDGLADTADGLWGGHDRARRLEIMKDSQIGTYGVLALGIVTGLRWLGLAVVLPVAPFAVIAAVAMSRGVMPAVMAALPHARATGLSHSVGRPGPALAGLSVALGVMLAVVCAGPMALALGALGLLVAGAMALLARAKIGGQTGDILGATQQMSELALLILMAAVWA